MAGYFLYLTLISLSILKFSDSYKILFVSNVPTPSHKHLAEGYVWPLIKRGHQVTAVTPFPSLKVHENLTQLNINFIMDSIPTDYINITNIMKEPDADDTSIWVDAMIISSKLMLEDQALKDLLKDNARNFDLVIVDWCFNDILIGLGQLYQCPVVLASAFDVYSDIMRLVDEPTNPSYTDVLMTTYPKPFSFKQRVSMLWQSLKHQFHFETLRRSYTSLYEEHFKQLASIRGVPVQDYDEMIYNVSLVLYNVHPSYASSIRLPQNVKSVAGYYIQDPPNPLPQDLQHIMDNAKHGVIYFSLGTNVKSKDFPVHIRNGLIEILSKLKQTVLWKFEDDQLMFPDNIVARKWMPQSSILAHPNTVLFITHGGLLSTTEAVHFGVPTIGIPFFGDQKANMRRSAANGNAIKVELTENLVQDLQIAIEKMLTDSKYRERARYTSWLYHHRPQPPTQEAMYWLEYAIETKGAPHLRSSALMLPWYQRYYFDFFALLLAGCFVMFCMGKLLCRRSSTKVKQKKH